MQVNYLSLRYFIEVAHCLNFSHAAQQLHISQPALSHQITTLEKELRVKLLNRTTRSVALTAEGEFLYKHLFPLFENINKTITDLIETGKDPQPIIRIASVPSAASNILPILIKRLKEKHPSIEYFIKETTSLHAIELVQKGEYHLALIRTPIDPKQKILMPLKWLEFSKYPLQLVVSCQHPEANKDEIDLFHFRNETFLHFDPISSPTMNYLLEQACLTAGFIPKTIGSGPEILTIANLIANGVGITLLPRDMIQLINSNQVRAISLKDKSHLSSLSAVWNKMNMPLYVEDALRLLEQM